MTAVITEKAQTIGAWSSRAISAAETNLTLLAALATSEMRAEALAAQLGRAQAGADKGGALELRAVAEVASLQGVFEAAGLTWNEEFSMVANVEHALAWMKLAIDQERDSVKALARELEVAKTVAVERHNAADNTDGLKAQLDEATLARDAEVANRMIDCDTIREAVATLDLPWNPACDLVWNVTHILEMLVASVSAAVPAADAEHVQSLQAEVVRLSDELAAAKKATAKDPAESRAARDLAKLLDALGTADVAVALRKIKERTAPLPVPADDGYECLDCKNTFELRPGSRPRRYCYTCRPDGRKEAASPTAEGPICQSCGESFRRVGNQRYCNECRIRQASGSPARSKGYGPRCETCKYGVPSKASDIGWECFAYKARECMPLTHGHYFEAGEKVVG